MKMINLGGFLLKGNTIRQKAIPSPYVTHPEEADNFQFPISIPLSADQVGYLGISKQDLV